MNANIYAAAKISPAKKYRIQLLQMKYSTELELILGRSETMLPNPSEPLVVFFDTSISHTTSFRIKIDRLSLNCVCVCVFPSILLLSYGTLNQYNDSFKTTNKSAKSGPEMIEIRPTHSNGPYHKVYVPI